MLNFTNTQDYSFLNQETLSALTVWGHGRSKGF